MRILLRDLQPSTDYSLQVRSVDVDGQASVWSRIFNLTTVTDSVPPSPPESLTLESVGDSFVAQWEAPTTSTDGSPLNDFKHYEVTVTSSLFAGVTRKFVTSDTKFELPFEMNVSIFGAPAATVTVEVAAADTNNNLSSSISDTASNPAPAAVTNLVAEEIADGIYLTWTQSTDLDVKHYEVWLSTSGAAGTYSEIAKTATSSYTHLSNLYGTDHWYRVYAVDKFNTKSASTQTTQAVRPSSPFLVDTTAPGVPTGLAGTIATTVDRAALNVSWTNGANPDNDLAGTVIGYRPVGSTDWSYTTVDYTLSSTRIENITPYVNYEIRARAYDWSANYSAWTNTVTTNTAATNTAPPTVTGVAITAGLDSVTVSWAESTADDVKNGAGVYLVQIATNNTFTTGLLEYRTGATQISVTGLAQNQTYYARVKAVDSAGLQSASWSTVVNAGTGDYPEGNPFSYTVSATAPSDPDVGDIWMDTASGFEKQWNGSNWVNTGNASIDYVDGQTDNLVKNYVTEYSVNSSETVAPTTGWSTATPTRTPGTFIWYRVVVTYGDDTTSTTSPALLTGNTGATGSQGIKGDPGDDGVSLYTWLKYADSPTTGMSDTPAGKTYIGLAYNKTSPTESTNYGDYQWSLIKGEQGIPGNPGADGQPTYTWVKYGDSPTTGMSDSPAGKTYIGLAFNKTTATESSTYGDYQWSLIQGPQGTPAPVIALTASTQVLTSPSGGGSTNPTTSTVTGTATNTTITVWEYSRNGGSFSATLPPGVSRASNVVTITGSTMTDRTITVRMADANGVADTLTVAKVLDGATGATGGTGGTGPAGADAYTVLLTNESHTFPGSTSAALAGSTATSVVAFKGTTQQNATIGTITGQVTGLTTAITNNGTSNATVTVTVTTALTTQSGVLTIPITVDGQTFSKRFSWSVAYTGQQGSQGNPGTPAATINLTATAQALTSPAAGGATTPTTAVVTGTATNTTISVWQYSVDGGTFSNTVPTGASRTGNVVTITGSTMTAKTIAVRMADANGIADTLTVAKVFDGATGSTGSPGSPGTPGADAYTVLLTNEAHAFPGSTTAALAGNTTSNVLAFKGSTQMAATIGTITGQVTGLTTSIASNGTTSANFTVTVTTALTTQSGVLTVPITVDGQTFSKRFSWSVTRQGATGGTGPTGVSVTSITPYFQTTASGAAAPAKPTASPPPGPWTATEPNYTPNTDLWRTERILFSNDTFTYTDVTKVSSYAAAATAIATADGKNKIYYSTGTPGTTNNVAGDRWVQYDGSNNIIGEWRGGGGTTWTPMSIASQFISNLDAGKLTANSAFITTLNIGAGGVIQSAGYTSGGSSGFQLSNTGLTIKGTGNLVAVEAVAAGTISAKTINIGATGILNVDSTGQIKSNNYAANSTGYRLSNSGLEINDGSIDAKALRTNTAVIGDLTIGQSANTLGSIKSFGYVAGTTGWKLDKSGLELNTGSVSAAALKIQNGHNMMPPAYADFEYGDAYYIGSFWNPRGQGKMNVSTGLANANKYNPANPNWKPFAGTQYMGLTTITGTSAVTAWFGETATDYNIEVVPGEKYILSGYFQNVSANNTQWNLTVKGNNGTTFTTFPINLGGGVNQTAYTRVWTTVTVPAGVTKVLVGLSNTNTTLSKALHIDALQFEPKVGALDTPSIWKPPATTTVHPSGITTGMIRSSADVTVNGTTYPAWSINMDGNIQVGDSLVRGKLLVGLSGDPDAGNSYISSGNFVTGSTGWKIDSAGTVEFSQGTFRGTLSAATFTGNSAIISGGIVTTDVSGNYAELSSLGLRVYTNTPGEGTIPSLVFGTGTDDYFSISDALGNINATISAQGVGSFTEISTDNLTVSGRSIDEVMDDQGRGIVAYGQRTSESALIATTEQPFLQLDFEARPGRTYRVKTSAMLVKNDSGTGRVLLRLRTNTSGAAQVTSTAQTYHRTYMHGNAGAWVAAPPLEFIWRTPTMATPENVSVLLSWQADGNGSAAIYAGANVPVHIVAEDIGPLVVDNGIDRSATTPPVTKKTYVTTWVASNSECYSGLTGNPVRVNTNDLVQGTVTASNQGLSHGLALFMAANSTGDQPNISVATALGGGAVIEKVEVYFYANHWYNGSGGTAIIRPQNWQSLTTSTPTGNTATVTGWARSQGRWVNITSQVTGSGGVGTGLRSVTIGKPPDSSTQYYGRFNAHNQSNPPKLRITYTK